LSSNVGADLEVWRPQLDHLRATRRVIAYDQRGHGESEKARDGAYNLEALVADLEAVRRALGLERMVLVGHSMSGPLSPSTPGHIRRPSPGSSTWTRSAISRPCRASS
jgi:pimeloyl-ACP methyl ester carboxylesterase